MPSAAWASERLAISDEALSVPGALTPTATRARRSTRWSSRRASRPGRRGGDAGASIWRRVEDALQHRALLYDKAGEEHYNLISALHKSLRGSDPDAALYWLGRMLEAGEDPLYVVRRLVRFASEDVGMADPQALVVCMAAQQAVHFIGMPEGALALAQAVVYLATAPKSNALYTAYSAVQEDVRATRNDPVPLHLRNAPTGLMKAAGLRQGLPLRPRRLRRPPDPADPTRPPPERPQEYLPERCRTANTTSPARQGDEGLDRRRG